MMKLNWRLFLSIPLLIALLAFGTASVWHAPDGVQLVSYSSESPTAVALDHASSDCAEDALHHGDGEVHCANASATIAAGPVFPAMKRKAGERITPLSDQIIESLLLDLLKRPPRHG